MSLLKKSLLGLFAIVAMVVLGGYILPSQVHVERQAVINASPDRIFAEVSNFNNWNHWSPWAEMDPNGTVTITGKGEAQVMSWSSDNPEVGSGTQTITQLDRPQLMATHLDFGDMGESEATFTLKPTGDGTLVTWSLDTDMRKGIPVLDQPLSTYFGFFMDSMVGEQYEAGLANLKAVVEG